MYQQKLLTTLKIIAIPTIYALLLRFVFGVSTWRGLFTMMSTTFLFLLPFIVGALTVYLSDREKVQKLSYRFFAPWLPIFGFLIITLIFAIEGLPCLLMILPIF